jgi:hypothetical protein
VKAGGAVETVCPQEFEEMKQELERLKAGGGVSEVCIFIFVFQ